VAAARRRERDGGVSAGEPEDDLLVIEYAAEPMRGDIFRKMGVHRIGDAYIPYVNLYERNWIVNDGEPLLLTHEDHLADQALLNDFPYLDMARRAFELCHIEYGRLDFGLVGGMPQVYEINFNPHLRRMISKKTDPDPVRRANMNWVDGEKIRALHALDGAGRGIAPTLNLPELLRFRLMPWRNYAPERY
jgi:hypothetical protein